MTAPTLKPLFWIGSSKEDYREFPDAVKEDMGFALYEAQRGTKSLAAKVLRGFGGAGVLEIVEDHNGNTYRAVYTVKFTGAVYVLHAFQKKSRKGIATPQGDMEKVRDRLKQAAVYHEEIFRRKRP